MFEKYRGLILTAIFIGAIIFLGYRTEQNVNNSIHKIIAEERTSEKTPHELNDQLADVQPNKSLTGDNASVLTPSQVEEIVKSYLLKNPQVVADALDSLQQIRMEEMKKKVQEQISLHKSDLENVASPMIGNANGSSVVVMFYDYNCGYCKQSWEAVETLTNTNSDVKVILKIYPILGNESEYLARLALAVNIKSPAKFKAIHNEFISNKVFNKDDLIRLFKEHGLDFEALETYGESEEITNQIKNNLALAKELHINGVPAFVINGSYYPGFLTAEQLIEKTKAQVPANTEEKDVSTNIQGGAMQPKEVETINNDEQ